MAATIVIAVRRRRERKFKRTSNTFTKGPTRRGRSAIDPNEVEWEKTAFWKCRTFGVKASTTCWG